MVQVSEFDGLRLSIRLRPLRRGLGLLIGFDCPLLFDGVCHRHAHRCHTGVLVIHRV